MAKDLARLTTMMDAYRVARGISSEPRDHLPTIPSQLADMVTYHESRGIIKKGQRCIELGCGMGFAEFVLNTEGYNVIGYELDGSLVRKAYELKEQLLAKDLLNPSLECVFRQESYFPAQYLDIIKKQRLDGLMTSEERGIRICGQEADFLHIVPGNVTPEELKTYDIFYAYPWMSQIPSLLELFSLYSKQDAVLLFMISGQEHMVNLFLSSYNLRNVTDRLFVKGYF